MTSSSAQNDTLSLSFYNSTNTLVQTLVLQQSGTVTAGGNTIGNYSQVNLENDFFTPSNGMTFVIESNDVYQVSIFLFRGFKVKAAVNGNPVFVGYIWDYDLQYTRDGGTRVTVKCKDLLEYMAQGTIFPNMGKTDSSGNPLNTNFHFKATDTLSYALTTIANAFASATATNNITVQTDNSGSLTFATGFSVGLRQKGKTPASRTKSLTSALNSLTTPMKGESYLAYMVRLAKHAGGNLKMSTSDDNVIYCASPTYDRANPSPFQLIHYLTPPSNANNNVLSANFKFSLEKQPSVVITEANTQGDGKFYQGSIKGVAINELTGFPLVPGTPQPISSVQSAVTNLTTGQLGTGYVLAPFNAQLYTQRANMFIDIDTTVSLPFYTVDYNAHTSDEVSFAASKILSEHQDRYVEFVYRVQGWTMAGTTAVWQPDMMVTIIEEIFAPGTTVKYNFPMWIRRVNFIKTRNGGTETEIFCTLPYTHNFEITP